MNKTGIEWCSMTWNTLRGCSWASPGCNNCYAEAIAKRFGKPGQPYDGCYDYQADSWSGVVKFIEHKLDEPLKVKTPQLIFANSMSDICHPEVKPEWIDDILEVIAATPQHFYMMLTKRPNLIDQKFYHVTVDCPIRELGGGDYLPNLAMGTSIEHPKFLWRAYRLLEQWPGDCFLSLEPLIEALSIKELLAHDTEDRIKQVIVGGESGKDARPMEANWVRWLRDEVKGYGRAFFFKQWGDGLFTRKWLKELGRTIDGHEWNESPWPVVLPINGGVTTEVALPLLAPCLYAATGSPSGRFDSPVDTSTINFAN
jgi:protein gp37